MGPFNLAVVAALAGPSSHPSLRPSVRSGQRASGGVPGYPPTLDEEVQDPLSEDFIQAAGQAALGGDAPALLQVVLDDYGLHGQVARGAQVQRATHHLLAVDNSSQPGRWSMATNSPSRPSSLPRLAPPAAAALFSSRFSRLCGAPRTQPTPPSWLCSCAGSAAASPCAFSRIGRRTPCTTRTGTLAAASGAAPSPW